MNNSAFYFFYNIAHRSDLWQKLVIFLGVYLPYIVALAAVVFILLYHRSWREVGRVFATGALAWVVAKGLKLLIHIPRPFVALPGVSPIYPETGFAFPSGHATFFAGLAIAIFFKHRSAGYVFLALAVIIGLARIALGVHFPVDILGGLLLGSGVAFLAKKL